MSPASPARQSRSADRSVTSCSEYNAFISKEELDDLLGQLSELLDAGILNLRPDASGKTNFNRIKGLLGTLIAARWFRKSGDDATRLLVSLDGEEARRWLHLSDDSLRADLVGFTWTNDHCTVSVIEVKAVDAKGAEYAVQDGVVERHRGRPDAVDPPTAGPGVLGQSRRRADHHSGAARDPPRAPLPRADQGDLHRRASASSGPSASSGCSTASVTTDLRCHLIDVRLGVDSSSLRNMSVVAQRGRGRDAIPVEITELNQRQIEVLIPPEPPEPEPEADEGGRRSRTHAPDRRASHRPRPRNPTEPPRSRRRPRPLSHPSPRRAPRRRSAAPERAATGPDRPRALPRHSARRVRQAARDLVRPAGARAPAAQPAPDDHGRDRQRQDAGDQGDPRRHAAVRGARADPRLQGRLLRAGLRGDRGIPRLRPERPEPAVQPAGTVCRPAQRPRQPDAPPASADRHHQTGLPARRSAGVPAARGDEGGL